MGTCQVGKEVVVFQAYKAKVNRKKKVLSTLIGQKPLWHGVLKEISQITPKNVYLKEVSFIYDEETKNVVMEISGEVFRGEKSVDFTVSQFSLDMKNSSYFAGVNLQNTKTSSRRGKNETLFSIKAFVVY